MHKFLEDFLKRHSEMVFLHFELGLLTKCIETIIVPGFELDMIDIKQMSLATLDNFNEFVINSLRKPNQ